MFIKMTLQEALDIQRKQIAHYGHLHPQGVAGLSKVMAARTNVEGMDLTIMRDVAEVNRYVPRGGDIEHILGVDYGGD
jgi:hypothetical protein